MGSSLNEEKYLYKTKNVNFPGFTNNPLNVLATSKQLPDILKIETRQLTRELKSKSYRDLKPLIEYQLWLEAGKLDKANFKSYANDNTNICFQSNVWRNFKNSCGLKSANANGTITESIASLYPMNIPVPSQLGSNTLAKYYRDNNVSSVKTNENLIKKLDKEAALMKYLRLKSELRNPPVDMNGRIIPPANYTSYQQLIRKVTQTKINMYIHFFLDSNSNSISVFFFILSSTTIKRLQNFNNKITILKTMKTTSYNEPTL